MGTTDLSKSPTQVPTIDPTSEVVINTETTTKRPTSEAEVQEGTESEESALDFWWLWLLVSVAALCMVALLVWAIRYKKKNKWVAPPEAGEGPELSVTPSNTMDRQLETWNGQSDEDADLDRQLDEWANA